MMQEEPLQSDEVEEEEEDEGFKPSSVGLKADTLAGKTQHGKLVQDIMKEQKQVRDKKRRGGGAVECDITGVALNR